MADRVEAAVAWFGIAAGDLAAAHALRTLGRPRHVVFLAQQASEKAVKALIAFGGVEPPRTHDLTVLVRHVPASVREATTILVLVELSDASTAARYPDDDQPADEPEYVERLLTAADAIVEATRTSLEGGGVPKSMLTER